MTASPSSPQFQRTLVYASLATILLIVVLSGWRAFQKKPSTDEAAESQPARSEVVVYTSMDEPTAAEVFKKIETRTGIHIVPQYDAEASKTTGLVNKIRGERAVPQADLYWNNEPYQMEQLAREGLLAPYDSPAAHDLPAGVRPESFLWTPMTLKPRVVAFAPGFPLFTASQPTKANPANSNSLAWWTTISPPAPVSGRPGGMAISNPQFGTARGHFAQLALALGWPAYRAWLTELREHRVRICDGNSVTVMLAARGEVALGWTDLDDVISSCAGQQPVGLFIPPGRPVLTPATVALIAHGPHPLEARKVFDALVSAEAEEWMARSEMRLVPIRPALRSRLLAENPPLWPPEVGNVDFAAFPDVPRIVEVMPEALQAAREILLQ